MTPGELLRRSDWRFLLPDSAPAKVAVYAEGRLAQSVTEFAGAAIDGDSRDAVGCQLAVVSRPDSSSLRTAFRALAAGGTCYSEWSGRLPGSPRRIRAQLEEAGFTDVRLYWMVPDSESAQAWFQVSPSVSGYPGIVRTIVAKSASSSAKGALLSLAVDLAYALHFFPALCSVARRSLEAGHASSGALADFPTWLAEGIASSEGLSANDVIPVMRTGGSDIENKVSWLVYTGATSDLRWVAKVPRTQALSASLRREHATLGRMNSAPAPINGVVVPRVAFWGERSGLPVLVQSALLGQSVVDELRQAEFADLARRFSAALADFGGRPEPAASGLWWSRLVEPWLERLAVSLEALGDPDLEPAVRSALSHLGDLPLVWAHNDCAPWNATIEGDRLGLFDWEDGVEEGLPLVDLVYLLANTAFMQDGTLETPGSLKSYRRMLDLDDARGLAFSRSLASYASQAGVGPEDIGLLRMATWVIHSAQDLEILIAKGGGPSKDVLTASVCLPILRAELADYGSRLAADRQAVPEADRPS